MAIEHHSRMTQGTKERYTCGQLIDEVYIIFRCTGSKEMVRQMQLPCMSEEDVEFAFPAPREWSGWGMDAESTLGLLSPLVLNSIIVCYRRESLQNNDQDHGAMCRCQQCAQVSGCRPLHQRQGVPHHLEIG
jgi:hypothetical protein